MILLSNAQWSKSKKYFLLAVISILFYSTIFSRLVIYCSTWHITNYNYLSTQFVQRWSKGFNSYKEVGTKLNGRDT